MDLQVFRNEKGIIICIKCGWIAVDVPEQLGILEAELRGTSTKTLYGIQCSYYDIALDGNCLLHIHRRTYSGMTFGNFTPYFTERYPF